MKNLPANIIIEKNKIASTTPWIILLEIKVSDTEILRLCNNTEDIEFQRNTYYAMPFNISASQTNAKGEIPTVTLQVSNVSRMLQPYIESYSGGVGMEVKLIVVNTAHLSENYTELEMTFDILGTEADANWVHFTLGAPNPLRKRFPQLRYIAEHCQWTFKSAECGYKGSATECKRTFEWCRLLGNTKRFGGYIGLSGGYLRIV